MKWRKQRDERGGREPEKSSGHRLNKRTQNHIIGGDASGRHSSAGGETLQAEWRCDTTALLFRRAGFLGFKLNLYKERFRAWRKHTGFVVPLFQKCHVTIVAGSRWNIELRCCPSPRRVGMEANANTLQGCKWLQIQVRIRGERFRVLFIYLFIQKARRKETRTVRDLANASRFVM